MIRNNQSIEKAEAVIQRTEIIVVDFSQEQSAAAAQLYPITRPYGLSLGDRACLALGLSRSLPIITANKVWQNLNIGVQVKVIR